ncbi:MAG: CRTAC1 family protein [Candidatus Omnitrophica bacterium]|nr:CRTAC1 family protein [Candidatus Omnitrophota bacterium]
MNQIIVILAGILWLSPIAAGRIFFVENAKERGIDFIQVNGSPQKDYIVEAKGAGVAIADLNGDGWDDIYLVNGATLKGKSIDPAPRNQLYLNQGDGSFRNATEESGLGDAGFGTGAYFADVDRDGDLDCYLTNYGPNQLYLNDGQMHFSAAVNAGGAQNAGWSTGAAFADINGDGFLDLYVGQYAEFSTEIADRMGTYASYHGEMMFIGPSSYKPANDNLFINNGDGTFRDETQKRGINSFATGRAFTVFFTDLDDDGDLDIYAANDTTCNNLYENNGQGYFEDIALLAGAGLSDGGKEQGGMGAAVRDVDGDLDLDIAVSNYHKEYNILYRNDGMLQFVDATFVKGVGQGTSPMVSFGMLLEDFNNDSWPDMFVSAGHVYPKADELTFLDGYAQKNAFFINQGDGFFQNATDAMGPAGELKGVSRGSAASDFDRDGDLDIVINNLDGEPFFLENRSEVGRWIQVAIQDERGMPAYGARIIVETKLRKQMAELYSSASFLSQSSATLHFGLGEADRVVRIWIRWPDGKEKEMIDAAVNQRLVIRKP